MLNYGKIVYNGIVIKGNNPNKRKDNKMVVTILKKEVLYHTITFNTEHIKKEDLIDYIEHDNVQDEEINDLSYYENCYILDGETYTIEEQHFYDSMYLSNETVLYTVVEEIEKAYTEQE